MITKVCIIVLNWNGARDTIECLKSIQELRIRNYELGIIVVDNGSTDDSISKIKKLSISHYPLAIISNKQNLGYAGGNNIGIRYALGKGADYVMVLNNDTILHSDSMIRIIETLKMDSRIGLASPKIYFAKGFEFHKNRYKKEDQGRVIWYAGGKIDWGNVYGSTRGVDEVDKGQYDKEGITDFATGTCMILTRKLIEEVGMFDERHFLYYEDTDLSERSRKAGLKVMYIPRAVVWHKVAQSSGIGSELNDYYITRNRLLFGIKYARLRTKFALVKESIKLLLNGRKWQKIGIRDFYFGRFGKGSWPPARRENEN